MCYNRSIYIFFILKHQFIHIMCSYILNSVIDCHIWYSIVIFSCYAVLNFAAVVLAPVFLFALLHATTYTKQLLDVSIWIDESCGKLVHSVVLYAFRSNHMSMIWVLNYIWRNLIHFMQLGNKSPVWITLSIIIINIL